MAIPPPPPAPGPPPPPIGNLKLGAPVFGKFYKFHSTISQYLANKKYLLHFK